MRILMLTQWFSPEPMFKGLPFAKELAKRGHEVEILTGFPNYPGGKVYDGYKIKPWQRDEIEGIRVNRVALYPSHDNSGIRRIVNYLSFAITSLVFGPWLVRKPDVVYVYNLITLAWTATFLRWLYGCKIVYDVQDLWPESVTSSGMLRNRFVRKLLDRWSLWAYKRADHIVVLSPGFKRNLQARGIPEEKVEVIYNWCQEDSSKTEQSDQALAGELGLDKTFNVMFAGTMGVMQGLDTMLDAASLCAENLPAVRFVLVGDGIDKERLQRRSTDLGLPNVVFVPRQPMSEMGKLFALADALLVHLKDTELFRITIPSKTQAYLATGRPIIMAMQGDAAALVEQAGAGIGCKSDDPAALATAVEKLYKMPEQDLLSLGANGRRYYWDKLSFKCGVDSFLSTFENMSALGPSKFRLLSKIFFDYILTVPGLLLISPFVLLVALLVRIKLGSPILFKQVRPGLRGEPFTMYKFRTMTDERDSVGNLLPDSQRLTRFGRFLRSTSLDEFPALLNVIKGEMSLVGPRPLLMEYLPLYSSEQARRHEVRPGITGWAQVNGRNAISWEDKFKLDVWYVDNRSLWLDIKILWMTFAKVFKREGISQEGQATAEKFRGTSPG